MYREKSRAFPPPNEWELKKSSGIPLLRCKFNIKNMYLYMLGRNNLRV